MRHLLAGLTCCVFAVLGASMALADRAAPPPADPAPAAAAPRLVPLAIKIDPKATHARLQIPAAMMPATGAEKGKTSAAGSRGRTLMAGVAMSLALCSLVLVRRGSRAKKIAAAVVVLGVTLAGAVQMASADVPFNGSNKDRVRPSPPGPAPSTVEFEVTKHGEGVTLILPPAMLGQLIPGPERGR